MSDTARPSTAEIVRRARERKLVVPGFNIPDLPMMAPVVQALRDQNAAGLVMVARLEWVKFHAGSLQAIRDEYEKVKDERFTRLHLDHVPVIDEDDKRVDFVPVIAEALDLGYESVMIDGSRLGLDDNIAATRQVAQMAHDKGAACEGELGAVMGHEAGPLPPYEELFATGKGFTDPGEAERFVRESRVDWLSVAVGNIHGAISDAKRGEKKPAARLSVEHLRKIQAGTDIPLVLHGGTGIRKEYIMEGIANGIAKINVATAIRQPYEALRGESVEKAQQAVYDTMVELITRELEIAGSAGELIGQD